mmetsp:Transcript_35287/g.54031  ORF Transcript_35287/g.54031 Transcript_35287/m.54031 type:complete len:105 (+) Transcript_35287:723-1037(+)
MVSSTRASQILSHNASSVTNAEGIKYLQNRLMSPPKSANRTARNRYLGSMRADPFVTSQQIIDNPGDNLLASQQDLMSQPETKHKKLEDHLPKLKIKKGKKKRP